MRCEWFFSLMNITRTISTRLKLQYLSWIGMRYHLKACCRSLMSNIWGDTKLEAISHHIQSNLLRLYCLSTWNQYFPKPLREHNTRLNVIIINFQFHFGYQIGKLNFKHECRVINYRHWLRLKAIKWSVWLVVTEIMTRTTERGGKRIEMSTQKIIFIDFVLSKSKQSIFDNYPFRMRWREF